MSSPRSAFFVCKCLSVLFVFASAVLVLPQAVLAEDCTEVAIIQAHELAVFSKMSDINRCETPEGVAAFKKSFALLKILNERDAKLRQICTKPDDSRFVYVTHTLKNLTSFFKNASRGCDEISKSHEGDEYVNRMGSAQRNEQQHNYADAAADYEILAQLGPPGSQLIPSYWANACRNRAAAGQIMLAIKDCDLAVASVPNDPTAHNARGLAYLKSGDFKRAISDFNAALAVYPNLAFSYYGRGLAKNGIGDTAGSDADIMKANQIDAIIGDVFQRYGVKLSSSKPSATSCVGANGESAEQDLGAIAKCKIVYCAPSTKPQLKGSLKRIDDRLIELQLRTAELDSAVQKVQRACQALSIKPNQGSKMDEFKTSSYELGIRYGRLSDLYDAFQTAPDQDLFAQVGASVARELKQPECMGQINEARNTMLNAAQQVMKKVDMSCDAVNR